MRTTKASKKSPKPGETVAVKTLSGERVVAVYDGAAYLVEGVAVEVDSWNRIGKTAGKVATTLAASAPAVKAPRNDGGFIASVRSVLGF